MLININELLEEFEYIDKKDAEKIVKINNYILGFLLCYLIFMIIFIIVITF